MRTASYKQCLYGIEYITLDAYKTIEAELLKYNYKKAALRQAIGLIATLDCLTHNDIDQKTAKKWSKYLNMKIVSADISDLVYYFVNMRELKHTNLRRPNDDDFSQAAEFWSSKLQTRINKEYVEHLLGLFVESKDFFENRVIEYL